MGCQTYIDGDKVFQRLAHFETFDMEVSCMEEVVDPRLASVIGLSRMRH